MTDSSKEIIKRVFDKSSEKFDEIGTPFFKHYGKVLADFANIEQHDSILDIACGKGATTFCISEMLSGEGKVTGIDISSKMIEECNKQKKHLKSNNTQFLVMDAEQLEFDDDSFDKVVCGFGLFFLPLIEKGLKEIKRALKPGGQLVFSSWNNAYQLTWLQDIIAKYIPDITKKNDRILDQIHADDFRTIPGIEKVLRLGGFTKEQIIVENLDCYYNSAEEWVESRWHTGYRMYFEKLSEKDYTSMKKEIIKNLQGYKENGRLKIVISAFITKASGS